MSHHRQANEKQRAEQLEPNRLEECRRDAKFNDRTSPIPHTVIIGGNDLEPVRACPQICVKCSPPTPRINPLIVDSFQLVLKADPLRDRDAERSVIDLDLRRASRED